MARQRWVYRQDPETGEVKAYEVGVDYEPPARLQISTDTHYVDTTTADGKPLGSRAAHRAYLRDNNLALADDFRQTWAKAEVQRQNAFKNDSARREALGRALYEARKGRK